MLKNGNIGSKNQNTQNKKIQKIHPPNHRKNIL